MIGIAHLHREGDKGSVVVAVVDIHHVDQGATGRTVVVDVVQLRTGVCSGAVHQLLELVRVHETQQWRRVGCCLLSRLRGSSDVSHAIRTGFGHLCWCGLLCTIGSTVKTKW